MTQDDRKVGLFTIIGPGILVAATGLGAGDLATASFTGLNLGVAVLWVVLVGAFLKFVLNEGLARWQLATGQTLLEGCVRHLGRPFQVVFLVYLVVWSLFVGTALMSACGVTAHAIFPIFDKPDTGKLWLGIFHSLLGVGLVYLGGYKLFETVMNVCIAAMFVTVVVTAILVRPDWGAVLKGLFVPAIPQFDAGGLVWTVALMSGVGGTLTVLCYGYWIRESGREGSDALRICRIDLGVAYGMTAVFGIVMVIIGSQVQVSGSGAGLMVALAECLEGPLGPIGKWMFLLGAWGAVFSSLLGVWQSVPYIFTDFCNLWSNNQTAECPRRVSSSSLTYRLYLFGLAVVPIFGLRYGFQSAQKYYAVFGACFMPFLAILLIYLNGHAGRIGQQHKNRVSTNTVLVGTLVFFLFSLYFMACETFGV
jgi:Mn2+/Fe2+ NRAMP family transporter